MPDIDIVAKLKTPEECVTFEKNVTERGRPDLALAARKRALANTSLIKLPANRPSR